MNLRYPLIAAVVVAASTLASAPVRAESRGDRSAAADAYRHAQRAALRGDAAEAARLYELADVLAPSPEALRSAVRAHLVSGREDRAATDAALLLERHGDDPRSRELAETVLAEHAGDFLRVALSCDAPCRVSVGARASLLRRSRHHVVFVEPGDHELVISFEDGAAIARSVAGNPGATVAMRVQPPAPLMVTATGDTGARSRGVDRRWFAASLALTATLAGGAAWAHEEDRGERWTGLLIGGALSAALTTATLAFVTDWRGGASERPPSGGLRLGAATGGATVGWGGSF